jgi:hypothetical protein
MQILLRRFSVESKSTWVVQDYYVALRLLTLTNDRFEPGKRNFAWRYTIYILPIAKFYNVKNYKFDFS